MAEKYKWVIARSGNSAELIDRDPRKIGADKPPAGFTPALPVNQTLGNLEGKELRFGTSAGATFAATTTAIACGSVNCMHDSLNPLAGLTPLTGMWLNCIFGGKGVGMVNLLIYLVVGVFIAGLMVGRTPEYLGKKVESREMKLAMMALLVHPILILMSTGYFAATDWGLKAMNNPGAAGFSEVLYEFSSASANNGSEFGGLTTAWGLHDPKSPNPPVPQNPPFDIATGLVMLFGRFLPVIAPIALAGELGRQETDSLYRGNNADRYLYLCLRSAGNHHSGWRTVVPASRGARPDRRTFRADAVWRLIRTIWSV